MAHLTSRSVMERDRTYRWYTLWLLFAINATNFFDRQVVSAVTEPLRREWSLSDTEIGLLGTSFTLLYAVAGIPLGRWADLGSRKRLLVSGLSAWSALTFVSGLCRNFWSLFAARLGVGLGEAACAPAATSLIGDLFPSERRARALSIFMLGLPVGLALSYAVSGAVARHCGWRPAFFVAGTPGLLLALAASPLREPVRGREESIVIGDSTRPGSPYLVLLAIPTMLWIILSGAIHNFNMYAFSSFLPAFLMRYHQVDVRTAGFIAGIVIGVVGGCGSLLGGWAGDAVQRRWPGRRLIVAGIAVLLSAPAAWLALTRPPGALLPFVALQGLAVLMLYAYYPIVYASIHDLVEPGLRGTAMAVYFFAMYALGASLGPVGAGWISDTMALRAAAAAGVRVAAGTIPEAFRSAGLHSAMFVVPILALALAAVLAGAARSAPRDVQRLRAWMLRERKQGGA